MSTESNLFAATHVHLANLNRRAALMRADIFQDLYHAAEFTRLMPHLLTSSSPVSCVYDKPLHCAASSSTIHPVPTVTSYTSAWAMGNGPHWCNGFNYSMRCSNWVLTRRLLHELSKKKIINMCHLNPEQDPVFYMQHLQMNQFTQILWIQSQTFMWGCFFFFFILDCTPPHWASTCRIIQGGMDSNGPHEKWHMLEAHAWILLAEWESQVGQQLAKRRSKRNKEIQLRASTLEQSGAVRTPSRNSLYNLSSHFLDQAV